MQVDGQHFRSIWLGAGGRTVEVIDQTRLPHVFEVRQLTTLEAAACAIETMVVRGAPLIGATAAHGVALAMAADPSDAGLRAAHERLLRTRPTAVNLHWALTQMLAALESLHPAQRRAAAVERAVSICDEDVVINEAIGRHGLALLERLAAERAPGRALNVLTHCNAGWLATVDWGTATAPLFKAHAAGLDIHVWVDETRPRNQGALTAWELAKQGVAHTFITDNAGGHLMQRGLVDLVLVGTDRTTATGDVGNKIGTYLKALAARDNGVPFYVALPSPTIDFGVRDGLTEIPIEERGDAEVATVTGRAPDGTLGTVAVVAAGSPVANPAFDVTPARLVTGLITERGIAPATATGIAALFDAPSGGAPVARRAAAVDT